MNHSLFIILIYLIYALCKTIEPNESKLTKTAPAISNEAIPERNPIITITHDDLPHKNTSTKIQNATILNQNVNQRLPGNDDVGLQSGALWRGVLVFLVVTILLIAYFVFRMFSVRTKKRNPIVVKYGVLTNRSDIEMEPLPLSDDDEEDTVFELQDSNNQANR